LLHFTGNQPLTARPRTVTFVPSANTVMISAPVLGAVRQRSPAPPVPTTMAVLVAGTGVTATTVVGGGYGYGVVDGTGSG
jgi:hypothetical protein